MIFGIRSPAHKVDSGADPDRPVLTPDPLESEPESDEEDRADGIFSPDFVKSTGVHVYMKMCREQNVVPVQQFISMLDHEVVSLKHRGVGSAGGKAIFECLRFNEHIQALDMEDNQLGLNVDVDRGALNHVCAAIRENKHLTNLDLSYNNFAGRGCATLAEALKDNLKIKEVSLRGNNMGDMGAQALQKNLGDSAKLLKLDVSDNGVGEEGGRWLGELIGQNKGLKQADFSWNAVRIIGCIEIANGLKGSTLLRLNLAWNGIGDKGAAAIGSALKENSVLQFLDVSSNKISLGDGPAGSPPKSPAEGARALAEGIRENNTLRSLQLNGNPITDKGVVLLIEAVGEQCSVRDLGLQDCATQLIGNASHLKFSDGIFDPKNPTGHYTLELGDAFDVERFEKLLELDKMDEASGIDNFINVVCDGQAVDFGTDGDIQTWKAPAAGTLQFDYVATKRVPKEAKAQRDEVFQSFRKELANPALSEETKLLMLRSSATTHYWSAEQVKQLVTLITYQRRVDAVVMLFRRIVNLDSFYHDVYQTLKPDERASLRRRLGESLARLLIEHEPQAVVADAAPADDDSGNVTVFLTETDEGGGGGEPVQAAGGSEATGGGEPGAAAAAEGPPGGSEEQPALA